MPALLLSERCLETVIDRIVSNVEIKSEPVRISDLFEASVVFREHFGREANRVEMSKQRWDKLRENHIKLLNYEDVKSLVGLEVVIDREMRDDVMRIVLEWTY